MSAARINETIGKYRWTICALVFFATTVNYFDRNVLGLLKTTLAEAGIFGPDKANQELYYSWVVMSFQIAYAIGMTLAGRFIDWIGTKRGYAFSLLGWSIAAIGHALAYNTFTFGIWRAALGFTESGNFPAANKTMAEWFPKKERALATGLYNSGTNIGAILTPLFVPWIAIHWGWQFAFIFVGAIGLIWLFFWFRIYASPEQKLKAGILKQAEYDYIHSDLDEKADKEAEMEPGGKAKVPWTKLLTLRQTWSFFFGKFLTDPVWWFYLFWLPAFLNGENARKILEFKTLNPTYAGDGSGVPGVISWTLAVAVVYTISTIGSIFGGWIPKRFINGGMATYKARKLSMFIYALFPLSVLLASWLGKFNTWYAVLVIGLACAAHQAWSANIFTTVSDMFPKKAVASVTGIGGMAGAVGGILIAQAAGLLLKHYTAIGKTELGYGVMFIYCGIAYLLAWIIMHFLVPRMKRVENL
ncbi:MAG: MFS transporter [Bacteroidales bacterium]|jgi:ACS family hexuronate transporter-like MFS transporter|nr:MFS transporter [Bacteroidales bacterium]